MWFHELFAARFGVSQLRAVHTCCLVRSVGGDVGGGVFGNVGDVVGTGVGIVEGCSVGAVVGSVVGAGVERAGVGGGARPAFKIDGGKKDFNNDDKYQCYLTFGNSGTITTKCTDVH